MVKFFKATALILALAVAACSAEPLRNGRFRSRVTAQRSRFLSRQEVESVTPYPSAAELKPEVPFDEAAPQPDQTYGPPDQTYGPPEVEQGPTVEELPSEDAPEEFAPEPNPEAEEFGSAEAEETEEEEEAASEPQISSRLTSRRRVTLRKQTKAPARLRLAKTKLQRKPVIAQRLTAVASPAAAPATVSVVQPQPQYVVLNSPFAYTAQFQSW